MDRGERLMGRAKDEVGPLEGTPLYVHVPFCVKKCTYCDFYSRPGSESEINQVVEDLLLEAQRCAPHHPRTLFVGGGTPTILSVDQIHRLFEGLEARTAYREAAVEVSVEANPESLTREKLAALRSHGVTRLTVGVQSLQPDLLELFGRVHTAEEGERGVQQVLEAGFASVGIDLIYAAPGQNLDQWTEDLSRALAWGVHHVSAYCLAFEEETALTRRLASGTLIELDEDRQLDFFRRTRTLLMESGRPPYEVSNFAPFGHHCDHNVNYWRGGDFVGIGPSAATKVKHERSGNPRSYAAWKEALDRGASPTAWRETLDPEGRLGETWWLGLRMEAGVDPTEARAAAGFDDPEDPAVSLAGSLVGEGWLEAHEGRFRLSPRARPLADAISQRFLALRSPVP